MKRSFLLSVILLTLIPALSKAQKARSEFTDATEKWFDAWLLLTKEIYDFHSFYPVDFIFFDSVNIYSNSDISIPTGEPVTGPGLLPNNANWKKAAHNGLIILPNSDTIPVGLMSFAGENKLTSKPFFVMPLPSFWQAAGVTSKELGLENLLTGVFLHEFSHSQQVQNFGKKIAGFERTTNFGIDFTDDIVQDLFSKDPVYSRLFKMEVNDLYKAVQEENIAERNEMIQHSLIAMDLRQERNFKDQYLPLGEIEDFFLTMEGLGQYSMYAWLTHPKGANLPKEQVITGVRRGKSQWSQDYGFAFFLLLEKYASADKWAPELFSTETTAVKKLLTTHILLNK
jgi:hypothetical protein